MRRRLVIEIMIASVALLFAFVFAVGRSSPRNDEGRGAENDVSGRQGHGERLADMPAGDPPAHSAAARSVTSAPRPTASVRATSGTPPTIPRVPTTVDDGTRAKRALDSADDALDDGDLLRARAFARECLGIDPSPIECHHDLTFSFTRGGEYGPELRQAIDDCLVMNPQDPYCLEVKVLSEVKAGNLEAARATLAVREAMTDQPPDYTGEAEVALASHQTAAACEAFRNACRLSQPYACTMVTKLCAASSHRTSTTR